MQNNTRSLVTLVSVFFFWGFLAASNGIFIPFCKTHFQLNQFQSQLVDTSFYGAYFIGSLIIYMISLSTGKDVLNKIGYKNGIIYGLLISIAGALLMVLAIHVESFPFILSAFFVIALGFSFQQTAANPFAISLGDPAKGSHRLSLAGGINSLGTTIGPLIVSMALFGKVVAGDSDKTNASIGSISNLYLLLCGAFAAAAILFSFAKMPRLTIENDTANKTKILKTPLIIIMSVLGLMTFFIGNLAIKKEGEDQRQFLFLMVSALLLLGMLLFFFYKYADLKKQNRFEIKSFPQLHWGMLAIFVYVGMEVAIQSNMGALLKTADFGSLNESRISRFISLYWGSLMIGRLTGAITVFNLRKTGRNILTIVLPFLVFVIILFVNKLSGNEINDLLIYALCICVLIAGFFFSREKPILTLLTFGILGITSMTIGLVSSGLIATYAFLSGGLFCSIMWPCIFTLSITGLKQYTSQASGFLIMMILGGALIPPLQGHICDLDKNSPGGILGLSFTHFSYVVPTICFAYLTFYAWKSGILLKAQGIDFDAADPMQNQH